MFSLTWSEGRTNREVLRMSREKRELMKIVRERLLILFGSHRREVDLEYDALTGMLEGTRARGERKETKYELRMLRGQTTSAYLIQQQKKKKK